LLILILLLSEALAGSLSVGMAFWWWPGISTVGLGCGWPP